MPSYQTDEQALLHAAESGRGREKQMCRTPSTGPVDRRLRQAGRCRAASMPTHDEELVDHGQVLVPTLLADLNQCAASDGGIPHDQQDVPVPAGDVGAEISAGRTIVPRQVPGRLVVERLGLLEDRLEVGPDRAAHG